MIYLPANGAEVLMQGWFPQLTERITKAFGSAGALGVVVGIALTCAIFLGLQGLQPSDDAYITFRHVKNLLEHGRPAWNLGGDPVLGSTTPAFLMVLGLFCRIFAVTQIDQGALYLNAVLHFVTVILTYLVMNDLVRSTLASILCALLVGLSSVSVYVFSQGFESALLSASLLGGLYFVRIGRDSLSVATASLAPLIRPEGVLLTALIWAYILLGRRFKARLLLACLPIPLVWIAFATAYYGSPVPHAIQAKKRFPLIYRPYDGEQVSLANRLPGVFSHAGKLWSEPAGPLLLTGSASGETESTAWKWRPWIMLLGLPLAIVASAVHPDGRIIYLLYAPLFLLFYGWIGHTMPWYFPSFVILSIVLLFAGWIRGTDLLLQRARHYANATPALSKLKQALYVAVFLVFLTANGYTFNSGEYRHRNRGPVFPTHPWGPRWDMFEAQRYYAYREAAEYLNRATARPAVAMISEVGVFGYYYHGDVIDTVGLCSPEALEFYPPPDWDIRDPEGHFYTKANNFTPTNMVMTLRPDFVVNSRFYIANLLHRRSPFLEKYEEVHRGGRVWGEPVLIYRRTAPRQGESHGR